MQIILGQKEILQLLPSRYPFLLVDRVIELEPGKRGIGVKNVTINEPYFVGHFPQDPIMPGATGKIEVKYDTNRVMPIRKTISVESNADTPVVSLKIKGEVIDPSKTSVLNKKEKSVMAQ